VRAFWIVLFFLRFTTALIWFGAGLYDLLLEGQVRGARGTPAEPVLARVYVRYGACVLGLAFVLAATTALMHLFPDQTGFLRGRVSVPGVVPSDFPLFAVIPLAIALAPSYARIKRTLRAVPAGAPELSSDTRAQLGRLRIGLYAIRACGVMSVLLLVMDPLV
jgi:hypothetical protein